MDDADALALLARVYTPENLRHDGGRAVYHVPATFGTDERAALAARGLAPGTLVTLTHDEAVTRLRAAAAGRDERAAADAFVASLASAPRSWRALLPAQVLGAVMPDHGHQGAAGRVCDVCFVAPSVTVDVTYAWFVRQRSGSPLTGDVVSYVLALEAAPPPPWPRPTPADRWVLHEVLTVLRALRADARYTGAERALHGHGVPAGWSRADHRSLLEDLALLGVLQTDEYPGLVTCFTTARQRDRRRSKRVEVDAPLGFWTGGDGVAAGAVDRLFGHLGPPAEPPDQPTPTPRPRRSAPRTPATPPELRGEARAGDVYAVGCREDAWVLAYCHQMREDGPRPYGLVEYLDGVFTELPTAADIAGRGFRSRGGDRWQQWTSALEKTARVRRLARDVPCPPDDRPVPDTVPSGNAADLRYLASHCFADLA